MKKDSLTFKVSSILCIALIAASALVATGCSDNGGKDADANNVAATSQQASGTFADGDVLGEGAQQFTFAVEDLDGAKVQATVNTDAETVGEALEQLGVIAGEEGEYGLYVKTVNGTTLDYNADGAYWAFYVDDQYATTGVDSTEVVDGSSYAFKAERG